MTFKITYESIRTEVSSYIYIYIYILHMTLYILYTSYKNLLRALLGQTVKCFKCTCKCSEVRLYARISYIINIYNVYI